LLSQYRQGALIEEYIEGRELTISVLGNTPPYALPIVERLYFGDVRIQLDEPEPATLELYEQITSRELKYTVVNGKSVAPADLTGDEVARIQAVTIAAFQILGCRDWARIDLRMDEQGNVYILDVNLEPAIGPEYAVATAALAAGWTYTELVNRILEHAIDRYPHLKQSKRRLERRRSVARSGMTLQPA
jgi:D-alanine-D-alanine ligase